jgi:hypothetical protein
MTQYQARADRVLRGPAGCSFALAAIVAAAVLLPAPASAEPCPNERLRGESGSTQLPDCRAYELVTPADKLGLSVEVESAGGAAVSSNGSHVLYFSQTPLGEQSTGLAGSYEATRTDGSWSSTSVAFVPGREHINFSNNIETVPVGGPPDLSILFYDTGIFERSVASGVYARNPDGSFVAISQGETGMATYVGSSADGSHAVFEGSAVVTKTSGGAEGGVLSLYDRTGGSTLPVGVDTSGAPTSTCGSILAGTNEQEIGAFSPLNHPNRFRDAVSAGGSRIFFESPDPRGHLFSSNSSCGDKGEVYVREDAATTREISISQKTGSVGAPAPNGAVFQGASANGARVVFRSPDQLTDDPAAASGGLYEYDLERGTLTFIAKGTVFGSRQQFYPQVSEDGTHVYFLGEVPGNGPAGQTSLYLWDDGRTSFVSAAPTEGTGAGKAVQARLSADGSTLAFTSASNLTSYDSHAASEVYVYRAGARSLVCVSCDVAGAAPRGDAEFYGSPARTAGIPSGNVTVDGSRVFFDSPDPLLPAAKNGLYNVYEYENGALHLLSDGNGPYSSRLVGASRDGADVIIQTDDSLVPQDQDNGNGDLYDVRIGGGFPYTPPVGCGGDPCQGQAGLAPVLSSASSSSYPAGENLAPPVAAPALKPPNRGEKLVQALRACRAKHSRHQRADRRARAACEAHARQKYASGHKAKRTPRRSR